MSREFLADRRRALEESFFARRDQELINKFKQQMVADQWKQAVATVSGIGDAALANELFPPEEGGESMAAVVLIPMVEVAWADGEIQPAERDAILRAAREKGLPEKGSAISLLESWLKENPQQKLLKTWKEYVAALAPTLSEEARQSLRREVIGRARKVAEAAGGFLGFGEKVSLSEEQVLQELEESLNGS